MRPTAYAIAALLVVACSVGGGTDLRFSEVGGPETAGDALTDAAPDAEQPDLQAPDAPPPDGQSCWPGYHYGCAVDGIALLVCRDDGEGLSPVPCVSETGGTGRCLDGHCTRCSPGERTCHGDDEVWQCDDTGDAWTTWQNCDGEATGQVCSLGTCARLCDLSIKWNTYLGCDYWGADLDNAFVEGGENGYHDAQGQQFAIVVSNPHDRFPTLVDITWFDEATGAVAPVLGEEYDAQLGWQRPFPSAPIGPGELRIFNLPRRDVNGTVQAPLAYHVHSSIPVTAYQFNPLSNVGVFSNDASLLLPANVFGTWYWVMTREQTFPELRSYVTVLAVQPGETQVEVRVTAPTLVGVPSGLAPLEPGDSVLRTLHQYDVLSLETNATGADMTGTSVLASKPVAVFGGSEAANAPNTNHCEGGMCVGDPGTPQTPCDTHDDCLTFNTCCADHLEEQLFPVKTWGRRYLCAQSYQQGFEEDVWRVIAAEDGTQVTTFPVQVDIPVLNAGEWFDFQANEHADDFELVATKPVMVGQFLTSQEAQQIPDDEAMGDPSFILVVPEEQFRTDYVFLAPDKYARDYVTVVAPREALVTFDDVPVDAGLWSDLGTGDNRAARFRIADGVHAVRADRPVGVYVYGVDRYVSYGYPAGLDLKPLNADAPTTGAP